MTSTSEITEFHVHVYFDAATREKAATLREALGARFAVQIGRWHDEPIGPHTRGSYQVKLGHDQLGAIVTWLMLNRDGLSILVHPRTGDDVADHAQYALWLGEPIALDIEVLRRYVERRESETRRTA